MWSDLLFRLRSLVRRRRAESDLEDEVRFHVEHEIEKHVRAGHSREDAERRAHLAFGGVTQVKEDVREAWGLDLLYAAVYDVRHGLRLLRRSPTFTAAAVLTMALGIGATTAIFSVVDATLLRPLPYPDPDELVNLIDDLPGVGAPDVGLSQPEWQDFDRSGLFTATSPAWFDEQNLTGGPRPLRVNLSIVGPSYFEVLGIHPELGHTFDAASHQPGVLPDVVISDGLWTRHFGRDPAILDRHVQLDTDLYHIVGVMPASFHAPGLTPDERNIDVWAASNFFGMPLLDQPLRNVRNLPETVARLRPGLTVAEAQHQLDGIVRALRERYSTDYPAQSEWTVRLVPLRDRVFGNVRQSLLLLLGAVALVLLIGSVNVANLLLARASTRARELAIRQALGAGRRRLTRQLLVESVLLSILGGLAGVAVLLVTRPLLLTLIPSGLPLLDEISIRWTAWLVALGASRLTRVAFGVVPAFQAHRLDITAQLKQEARGSTQGRGHARTRRSLVVAECALSLTLMVAAALLLRSFWAVEHTRLGFTPDEVMTVRTRLPYPNDPTTDVYRTVPQKAALFREVLRRTRTLPGVDEVAIGNATSLPLDHKQRDANLVPVFLEGRDPLGHDAPLVNGAVVTPEYFHLLRISLLRGRLFTDFDDDRSAPVALVNAAMAAMYWPREDALGKRLKLRRDAIQWTTVVGVVADTRVDALDESRVPQVYASLYQRNDKRLAVFLRGALDPASIAEGVRAAIQTVDDRLPVFGAQALTTTVSASLAQRRFALDMVGLFGLTALLLSAIGIYGVIAYMVGERTHEIGIRLALGASRSSIVGSVLRQAVELAAAGLAVGMVGAAIVARLMAGLLYGVAPTDASVYLAVAVRLASIRSRPCGRRRRRTRPGRRKRHVRACTVSARSPTR
jgi:predicted permease